MLAVFLEYHVQGSVLGPLLFSQYYYYYYAVDDAR